MTIIVVVQPDKILNTAQLIVMVQSPDLRFGLEIPALYRFRVQSGTVNIVLSVRYANIM